VADCGDPRLGASRGDPADRPNNGSVFSGCFGRAGAWASLAGGGAAGWAPFADGWGGEAGFAAGRAGIGSVGTGFAAGAGVDGGEAALDAFEDCAAGGVSGMTANSRSVGAWEGVAAAVFLS
jgi:hypothetical protein